jgi:hypothetical protein
MDSSLTQLFQQYPPNTPQFDPQQYEEFLSKTVDELSKTTQTDSLFGKMLPYLTIIIRSNRHTLRSLATRVLTLIFERDNQESRDKNVDQIINILYQLTMYANYKIILILL